MQIFGSIKRSGCPKIGSCFRYTIPKLVRAFCAIISGFVSFVGNTTFNLISLSRWRISSVICAFLVMLILIFVSSDGCMPNFAMRIFSIASLDFFLFLSDSLTLFTTSGWDLKYCLIPILCLRLVSSEAWRPYLPTLVVCPFLNDPEDSAIAIHPSSLPRSANLAISLIGGSSALMSS